MTPKEELVKVCRKVYENGYVAAYDGNLSARISENEILVTPSGKCKGEIEIDDLLTVDKTGKLREGYGKVSSEIKIHILAYVNRPEINSVIHCHPPYATAFATMGEGFTRPVFPEVVLSLGKVPLCKYGTPSTDEVPDSMKPHITYANAMLLENHGAVTLGNDIMDAYYKMEKLEHSAKILAVVRSMGREKTLPLVKLKELYNIAEKTFGSKIDKQNRMDY
jgi:L-fuculose-phosphate aldolase